MPPKLSISETSPSNWLLSYTGQSLQGSYHSAEMQSVYTSIIADWAIYSVTGVQISDISTYYSYTVHEK